MVCLPINVLAMFVLDRGLAENVSVWLQMPPTLFLLRQYQFESREPHDSKFSVNEIYVNSVPVRILENSPRTRTYTILFYFFSLSILFIDQCFPPLLISIPAGKHKTSIARCLLR